MASAAPGAQAAHLGSNATTREILAATATTNDFGDGELLPDLLEQVAEPIDQVSGDGAYDKRPCYAALHAHRIARVAIPPRRNARI